MTQTFGRYSELLGDERPTIKTRGTCGRLITADARFAMMVAVLHLPSHRNGVLTMREWWDFCAEGDQVHEKFDEAWIKFKQDFSTDDWHALDERLCLVIESGIARLEQLVARFPQKSGLIDF